MSDLPFKRAHVADLEDLNTRPPNLYLSVAVQPTERRAKLRPISLARVAVNNSTIFKHPNLRGRTSGQHSLAELYNAPNRQQALRDNAENNSIDNMAQTSGTSKTRAADRADFSSSDASGVYSTAGDGETDSSAESRSFFSASNITSTNAENSRIAPSVDQMIPSSSTSAVEKELPAIPVLRDTHFPELRPIYDATDAGFDLPPFPFHTSFASQSSFGESTAETLFDDDHHASPAPNMAFRSQDLTSASNDNLNEHTRGSPKLLGTSAITLTSGNELKSINNFAKAPASSSLSGSGSGSGGSRRHPSTSDTGSPVARNRIPTSNTSQSSFRGCDASSEGGKARVASNGKGNFEKADSMYLPSPDTSSLCESIKATQEDMYRLESDSENEALDDGAISPVQGDDSMRRSNKYDCGPTVRYSVDCREVIMGETGDQPFSVRNLTDARIAVRDKYKALKTVNTKSNLRNADGTTKGGERSYTEVHLHMSDKIISARAGPNAVTCEPKLAPKSLRDPRAKDANRGSITAGGTFPARTSSLVSPEVDKQTAVPSFASHLARPTASSAAREAASKAAIATSNTNRLNNKVSSGALRYSTGPPISGNPKISGHVSRKSLPASGTMSSVRRAGQDLKSKFSSMMASRKSTDKSRPSNVNGLTSVDEKISDATPHSLPRQASRNMTTYKNSGMERNTSQIIRPYDKTPMLHNIADRGEGNAIGTTNARPIDTEHTRLGMGTLPFSGNAVIPNAESLASSNGNAGPVIPRSVNVLDLNNALGPLPSTQASANGDHADDMTDAMLQAAQADLLEVIRFADHVTDPARRREILAIIQLLGTSIGRARDLRIATLAQQTTNMDLAHAIREFGAQMAASL